MKREMRGFVTGFLVALLIVGSTMTVLAANQNIAQLYDNVRVYVNGTEITMRDANGNIVKPFIYNGTTYFPVRAIGEALDEIVVWDQKTKSVYIGVPPSKLGKQDFIYYAEYPEVVDFGWVANCNMVQDSWGSTGSIRMYTYSVKDFEPESVAVYAKVLLEDGFRSWNSEHESISYYAKGDNLLVGIALDASNENVIIMIGRE